MLLYLVLVLLVNSICSQDVSNYTTNTVNTDTDIYYPSEQWSDAFDWKLLKVLSGQSANVLISPLSLRLVLAILFEGSSGSTQREFESGLKFSKKAILRDKFKASLDALQVNQNSDNILKLSTRLFLDEEIEPKDKYAQKIKEYYNADIVGTNFSDPQLSSSTINDWVSQATLGLIPRLIEPEDIKDMTLLLTNAVYFKGLWKHQFLKQDTALGKFYIAPTEVIYIPFMTTTDMFYYYESPVLDAKILRLPYKDNQFSMFIILPFSKGGLTELISKINLFDLHRQLYYLDKKLVQVSIPKFKFKLKASYSNILREFGLRTMFQNTASFPGIAKGNTTILRKLVVSDVLQSTGIEVDEEGSISYAATDVVIGNKIGLPDNSFNATQPFLFFIQEEKSGIVFFIGKMENPLQQELEIQQVKNEELDISQSVTLAP